jgi:subtilisin family serine protease
VVAAAGNDSTEERLFPAGFTEPVQGEPGLPIAAVGSLNTSPSTVALFSNAGTWVNAYRPGAAVVSTMPTNFQGPGGASTQVPAGAARARATIDPDDYGSGFGVWSGTSFAAPVLAAEVAAALAAERSVGTVSVASMRRRAEKALSKTLEVKP